MKALEAFESALDALCSAEMPLILLRERAFDEQAASDGGDYDLLAPSRRFEEVIGSLLDALLDVPVSVIVHAAKPEKRLIEIHDPGGGCVQIDLWREHRVEAPGIGRTLRVVHESLRASSSLQGKVLRMAPWLEAALFFCHLHEKKKDVTAPGVQTRLDRYRSLDLRCPEGLEAWTERLQAAPEAIRDGRMDAPAAATLGAEVLAEAGVLSSLVGAGERARWWWRRRKRSVARRLGAGPVVAVQGPDGAGKTTIIEALCKGGPAGEPDVPWPRLEPVVFKRLYRRSIFRWLYKLVRKLRRLRDRSEPKEVVETALSPFLFLGALVNYRLLRAFTGKRRGCVFDRFFPDLLITNRKAEGKELAWTRASRLLEPWTPRAEVAILLAAHPDVLRARKAEMTSENARTYLRLIAEHHVRRPPVDFIVLRTDIPLDRSLALLKKALASVR